MEQVCLTQHTTGGGCGCKIDPADLREILSKIPKFWNDENLVVGISNSDDAAVYKISEEHGIIITNDFFTPIVDDPYDFGKIAATNSISDIYAMGGKPLVAVSIVGFPVNKLPLHVMQEIMRGGIDACSSVGIPLAGGHSINNESPIFGLCVIGIIPLRHIKTNSGARPGDDLILTKPLGIGILSTALKVGMLSSSGYQSMVEAMTAMNSVGGLLGEMEHVHALTDITGFGLAGHALEMATGAGLSIRIDGSSVPLLPEALEMAIDGIVPGGSYRNLSAYGEHIEFVGVPHAEQLIFTDPQTSGGLLIAVDPSHTETVLAKLRESGCLASSVIGKAVPSLDGKFKVIVHRDA